MKHHEVHQIKKLLKLTPTISDVLLKEIYGEQRRDFSSGFFIFKSKETNSRYAFLKSIQTIEEKHKTTAVFSTNGSDFLSEPFQHHNTRKSIFSFYDSPTEVISSAVRLFDEGVDSIILDFDRELFEQEVLGLRGRSFNACDELIRLVEYYLKHNNPNQTLFLFLSGPGNPSTMTADMSSNLHLIEMHAKAAIYLEKEEKSHYTFQIEYNRLQKIQNWTKILVRGND